MPKDPKRNIESYQLRGGRLNEFEFQKSQSEMAEESEPPINVDTDNSNLTQAEHVADVTAQAHEKVEERRRRGIAKTGARSIAAGKKSAKKATRKSAAKKATRKSAAKKATRKAVTKKATRKAATKKATRAKAKKGANAKTRRSRRPASR